MVGLRTACSWVLVTWVVLSPMTLSWHRALAHSPHNSETSVCCSSTAEPRTVSCPFGNDPVENKSAGTCSSWSEPATSPCSHCPGHEDKSCQICELLWHDDIVTVEWFEITHSEQVVLAERFFEIRLPTLPLVSAWSVRGPPSVA